MATIFRRELVYVLFNQTLLSIASVLIVVILARYTTEEVFGEIRYLIAALTILSFWSLPGISLVINQQSSSLTREELRALIFTQFHWGILALGGSLALAAFHMFRGDEALAYAFVVGAILTPIANLYLVPGIVLAGLKRFGLKTVCDAAVILGTLGGIALGIRYFDSPAEIMLVYFGVQGVLTVGALMLVSRALPHKKRLKNQKELEARTEDGRTLTYVQIPFSLIPAIEKAVVFFVLGPASLALFVVASLPVEHFKSAFRNLMQFYMLPHTNEHDPARLIHWFLTGAFFLAIGVAALALFILYGMPLLFENFDKAQTLSLFLIVSVLPLPMHVIAIQWIAKRTTEKLARYALFSVITNIILVGSGALMWGIWGAIAGKILYELALAGGLLSVDQRLKKSV